MTQTQGSIYSWGRNYEGQLGDGTTMSTSAASGSHTAVPAVGNHQFISVVGGKRHSLGLKADGSIWSYGDNSYGQLGDGSLIGKSSPISVPTNTKFVEIAPASDHNLAIDDNSDIHSWGRNDYGQLGLGTVSTSGTSPEQIAFVGGIEFTQYFTNGVHWICLSNCTWDGDSYNESGPGLNVRPVTGTWYVDFRPDYIRVTVDSSYTFKLNDNTGTSVVNLAVTPGVNVLPITWQGNDLGPSVPAGYVARISNASGDIENIEFGFISGIGIKKFSTVSTGLDHSLAIDDDGIVWAWGRNQSGQLGDGTQVDKSLPITVAGLPSKRFTRVTGGAEHSCAMTIDGDIWSWGDNTYTQSAPASATNPVLTPTNIISGGYRDIDAGGYHNIALRDDLRPFCWGRNDSGQLGDNTTDDKSEPTLVNGNHKFIDISGGEFHNFALKADGTICTWGEAHWGKLLYPLDTVPTTAAQSTPQCGTPVPAEICTWQLPNNGNYEHAFVLKCGSSWEAWSWGCNVNGKLGDGTTTNQSVPQSVLGDIKWIDLSGGEEFSLGLDENGKLWAWGDDSLGQLGDG